MRLSENNRTKQSIEESKKRIGLKDEIMFHTKPVYLLDHTPATSKNFSKPGLNISETLDTHIRLLSNSSFTSVLWVPLF